LNTLPLVLLLISTLFATNQTDKPTPDGKSISVSSTEVFFDSMFVHSVKSKEVAIMTTGSAPILIKSIIGKTDGIGLSIDTPTTPMIMAPMSVTVFKLTFAPKDSDLEHGTVTITTDSAEMPVVKIDVWATTYDPERCLVSFIKPK
jgi:hypothetical protein